MSFSLDCLCNLINTRNREIFIKIPSYGTNRSTSQYGFAKQVAEITMVKDNIGSKMFLQIMVIVRLANNIKPYQNKVLEIMPT